MKRVVVSHLDGDAVRDADLEVFPAHPESAVTDFERDRVERAGRRAADVRAVGGEYAAVAGALEPAVLRDPTDRASQVRTEGREDADLSRVVTEPAHVDGMALPDL